MAKFDLHTHTKYSKCSLLSPEKLVRAVKKKGLDGVAVTDHNSIKGALAAKKIALRHGVKVIIGEEIMTDKGEVIGYYLNEEVKPGRFNEVVDSIKEQGGVTSLAHPYSWGIIRKSSLGAVDAREAKAIVRRVDAIETINGRTPYGSNKLAHRTALDNDKAETAGSDGHMSWEMGNAYTEFTGDLRKAILKRKTQVHGYNPNMWTNRGISFAIKYLSVFRNPK